MTVQIGIALPPGPLGPRPCSSVRAFADLGLDDNEIARYFRVESRLITCLLAASAANSSHRPARQFGRFARAVERHRRKHALRRGA
jgi:hypothetical protein